MHAHIHMYIYMRILSILSPSVLVDHRRCQDIIVINQLIIPPCPVTFKITIFSYSCTTTKFIHANIFCDKRSSNSEQTLWEKNRLASYNRFTCMVSLLLTLNLSSVSCNNKNTILILDYNLTLTAR